MIAHRRSLFLFTIILLGTTSCNSLTSSKPKQNIKLAEEIQYNSEMENQRKAKKEDFNWQKDVSLSQVQKIIRMERNAVNGKSNLEKELSGVKEGEYYHYLIVQKLAGMEINKKNYVEASAVWDKYKKLFPKKQKDIEEIQSILEEDETGFKMVDLGKEVNSGQTHSPVPELNGNKMFFARKSKNSGEDIYESAFVDGSWTSVKPLLELNSKSNEAVDSISPDGTKLFFFGNYEASYGNGDIFYSQLTDKGWTKILHLASPINSEYFDSDAYMTADNKAILFASDRPNGPFEYHKVGEYFNAGIGGNTDIYVSFIDSSGQYSSPKNLGPMLNTPGSERTPFLHPDGKTLYFSSNGYNSFGEMDLYKSIRLDDTWQNWSTPLHLGKIFNTSGNDWGLKLTAASDKAYLTARVDGKKSLFIVEPLPKRAKPEQVEAGAFGTALDENKKPMEVEIEWQDMATGKVLGQLTTKAGSGDFSIPLPVGIEYVFFAKKKGYLTQSQNVDLRKDSGYKEVLIEMPVLPIKAAVANNTEITLNNLVFKPNSDELEPKSFPELNRLIEILKSEPSMKIEIQGHTSGTGKREEFDMRLSANRALFIKKYLISKEIEPTRLSSKGFGSTKPIYPNTTAENRKKNRRVTFVVIP